MSCYTIPAMSNSSNFSDLDFVAKYVDQLMSKTGDLDYSVVYEWGPHGPGPFPPLAVYFRVDGAWDRREVLVSLRRKGGKWRYKWTVEGDVNDH